MKTPEQMAEEFFENWQPEKPKYIRPKARQYALEKVTECFLAGYQAAMNSPEKQDSCEHILDMEKMVDVNSSNNSNGWISVKERLPEIKEWVLIDGPSICQRIDPPSANWKAEYAWNTDHESFYYPDDVTHWMPLPKPPEKK